MTLITSGNAKFKGPQIRKKTTKVGPRIGRKTKLTLLLIFSSCSISLVYFMFFEVSVAPFPRPLMMLGLASVSYVLKLKEMTCDLPDLNPFDPAVEDYIESPPDVHCTDFPRIFTTDLNRTLIQIAEPGRFGYSECCFESFEKFPGLDPSANYSMTCEPITKENTVIDPPIEFVRINCFNGSDTVPVDFFGFILPKTPMQFSNDDQQKPTDKMYKRPAKTLAETPREVNVVILGFDGVSHMNFQRVMPLSYAFLTKNLSAVGMSGYTKVGDATFDNIVPAFTGLNATELKKFWNWQMMMDVCPFIWKNFSNQGYLTAYGEDSRNLGNFFHDNRKGFNLTPTNYYYNTLTFEMDLRIGRKVRENSKWCYGSRLSFEILLDFLKKMAFNMNKVQRYFQLVWATALTHDELNGAMVGDQLLLETLTWFKNEGYLDDTVLILMSDHGTRTGKILDTLQGKLESRMPLLYFVFPPWFIKQYQYAINNLKTNGGKVTTHFDLYETLLDLIFLQNITKEKIESRELHLLKNRPRGISLFLNIPAARECEEAGIPNMWCVCRVRTPVTEGDQELMKEAAEHAVEFINRLFIPLPQFANLSVKAIHDAQIFENSNSNMSDTSYERGSSKDAQLVTGKNVTLSITFSTSPSNATFEMTTTREINGTWTISKEIARTNLYGNQSWCVDDYKMKMLCFCKSLTFSFDPVLK